MIYADRLPARIFEALGDRRRFSLSDVVDLLVPKTYAERNNVWRVLRQMQRRGLIRRLDDRTFERMDDTRSRPLWRHLYVRREVSLEELYETAGLSKDYVNRWVALMVKSGHLLKVGSRVRLLTLQVEEPPVRMIREKKAETKTSETKQFKKAHARKPSVSKGGSRRKGGNNNVASGQK